MKFVLVIAMTATIGINTWAAQPRQAGEQVTVCVEDAPDAIELPRAELVASKMFKPIGVTLIWRLACAAGDGIRIGLSLNTSANEHPGALAYARPYEGVHIVVFYDRIKHSVSPDLRAAILAHVFVHEISHILENVDRHSESGVMKAHWTAADYAKMRAKPLPFNELDIRLIHQGLAARVASLAARNVSEIPSQERFQ